MSRPRKNTKEGREASNKWRETMIKKYGSKEAFKEALRKQGAKGGIAGHTGGFYANPELAREAGRKGGKISRRGRDNVEKWQKIGAEAQAMYDMGTPVATIARKFEVKYSTMMAFLKKGK